MIPPQPKRQPEGTLRPDQVADLALYMQQDRFMNLSDPGTGKTPSVCAFTQYLWEHQQARSVWAMPKSLLRKNRKELLKFTTFDPDDVVIVNGTKEQRAKQLASSAKVKLMGFRRFSDEWRDLLEQYPDTQALQVDEVHMGYKGHESARTQSLYRAMRRMKYYLPMSGTILDGRLDAAYPSIHIIEPRYYSSLQHFNAYHGLFDLEGTQYGWTNHDKLGRILMKHGVRHPFEEIFGKEAKVVTKIPCPMSKKQREAYDEFAENAILELEDCFLVGHMPGVHTIRCRQIMAHPETFGLCKGEMTGKDERLTVDLADHAARKEPFIIYASLIPEQERILKLCQKAGLRVAVINGKTPDKKRYEADDAFQAGELDGIVGSQACAAVGYNWGHVNHVIMISLDYMDGNFAQSYRRAIRGKRDTPLRVSVYEYDKSIDQRIFRIVTTKSVDANKVDSTYQVINFNEGGYEDPTDREFRLALEKQHHLAAFK